MQILVSSLKNNKLISINGSNLDSWVYEELKDLSLEILNLNFNLNLIKKGDFINAEGNIVGNFNLTCVRCLEKIAFSINENFNLFLYNENIKVSSGANEIELNVKDLDFIFIEGSQIYPAKIIREQLILSLPDYPICNENNAKCHCKCKNDSLIENANLN